jgi:hypothetical protein
MDVMQRYPVKPDTAIQLPKREPAEKKPAPRREPTAKQQLARLRSVNKGLLIMIAVLSVLLCVMGVMLIHTLNQPEAPSNIGRNYTTDAQQRP